MINNFKKFLLQGYIYHTLNLICLRYSSL